MICSKCGNEINDNAKFCDNCGKKTKISSKHNKIKPTQKVCNRCGSKISKDAVFCYKCGNNTAQTDVVSQELLDGVNQNTQQQNYNSPNENVYTETNKKVNKKTSKRKSVWRWVLSVFAVVLGLTIIYNSFDKMELTNTYTNTEEGISFIYPEGWDNIDDMSNQGREIDTFKSQKLLKLFPIMRITVQREDPERFTIETIKPSIYEIYNEDGVKAEDIIDTKIDGVDAIKVTAKRFGCIKVITYFYVIDGNVYQINLGSLTHSFDKYEPMFDAIMESYKITLPTETPQEQNSETNKQSDDYGLSEEEALEVAQEFVNTHGLYERTITGNIEYEPKNDRYSTKGLYGIELVDNNGLTTTMWVDKKTGSVLLSSDGNTLKDADEVYDEVYKSSHNCNEILFDGIKLSKYLESGSNYIYDNFGQAKYGTEIDGSLYDEWQYIGYDGVSFLYVDPAHIDRISGNPEMFTMWNATLNIKRSEIVGLLDTPSREYHMYNSSTGDYDYFIEYDMDKYTLVFKFKDRYSDADTIDVYEY